MRTTQANDGNRELHAPVAAREEEEEVGEGGEAEAEAEGMESGREGGALHTPTQHKNTRVQYNTIHRIDGMIMPSGRSNSARAAGTVS
jgi:hypothetical protein